MVEIKCKTCNSVMAKMDDFYRCKQYPLCTTVLDFKGRFKEQINNNNDNIMCPKCGSEMRKRKGKFGDFYGCNAYHATGCNGTRRLEEVEIYGHGIEDVDFNEIETVVKCDELEDDDDTKLIETEKFPHLKFSFDKFNPVQSRVFEFYDKDVNMVIAAATSAGKTTVAEMVMSDAIVKGKKAIFLSPLKAVSQEKYDDWTNEKHGFSKKNVSIVTGDYTLTDKRIKELNDADVVLMTSEMLDSRTRRIHIEKNDWLLDTGVLVCDESHLTGMKGRGDRLESAIMRFTKQNPGCRIIFLSATMPNVSELANWLTSLNEKKTELINSNYRPVQLDIHYVKYKDKGNYRTVEDRKIEEVIRLVKIHSEDKFIVFVHSKKMGRDIYSRLKEKRENSEFHCSEINLKERVEITEKFRKDLRIIVATSTLAWGINAPARRVIIVGVHRGLNEVNPLDIKQMAGRSGRVGLDVKGDAYILLPENRFKQYQNYCENIPPIESTMNNKETLAFHVVTEIAQGNVNNISTLMDWYNRSLAAFQNNLLDRISAEELLDKLVSIKVIEREETEDDDKYSITKLGMVASILYFSPYSIAGWYFNFNKIFKENIICDASIGWALANISENFKDFADKKLQEELNDFKYACKNLDLNVNDGIAVKGLFFHACLTNSYDVDNVYKNNVKFDIERTITALKMIDNSFAFWNKETFFKKLELRIKYEVPEHMTDLCILKGIGTVFVRELFNADITRPQDLVIRKDTAKSILGKRYQKVLKDNNLI